MPEYSLAQAEVLQEQELSSEGGGVHATHAGD